MADSFVDISETEFLTIISGKGVISDYCRVADILPILQPQKQKRKPGVEKTMRRLYLCIIWIFLFALSSYSQTAIRYRVAPAVAPDSVDLVYYGKKRFFPAALTVVGLNLGVWTFDRYIQKGDFAYISLNSIKENFRHGFIWDNDRMGTNMFLHPYHGNLYYNAARSNGFNYWQSGLFAFGGSAMWEMFMECEYPSTNDIIATPIGGMAIGEVAYRASDIILDDRKTGWERFGRETAALLVSPMRGLTRIINGDAWRKRPTTGRQFGIPPVSIEFSGGMRILELKDEVFDKGIGFCSVINVEYGDRFQHKSHQPYDYFSMRLNLNVQGSQPALGRLNILGRLINRAVVDNGSNFLSVGMYQHFDYFDSDTISDVSAKTPYKICTPASVGAGLMYKYRRMKFGSMDAYLHFNGVILGGVLSDHYRVDERNYNLGCGFSVKSGLNFSFFREGLALTFLHDFFRMFTYRGYPEKMDWTDYNPKTLDAQGDVSQASFHVLEFRADVRLWKRMFLTASLMHFRRNTNYKYFPDVSSNTAEARLMLTWKL